MNRNDIETAQVNAGEEALMASLRRRGLIEPADSLRDEQVIDLPPAAAHMFPSDLGKFKENETFAYAYSIEVGKPDETSVALYTLADMMAYAKKKFQLLT